ncbi:unnamed protein product [Ectocarpus sp. 12 AP-2014]
MEGNIRTKIGQGLLFGGATPPSMPSTPAGGKFAISMVAGGGTEEEDPPAEQRLRRNPGDRLCRTISTMDDSVVVAQLCAISPRVMDSAYCASPEAPGSCFIDSGGGGGCGSPPALAPLAPPSAGRAPAAGSRSPGWGSTSCPPGNDLPVLQRLGYNRGGGGSGSDRKSYGGGGRIPQLSASKGGGGGGEGGGGHPDFPSSTGASAATSCNPGGGSGGPDLPRRSHRRQLSSGSGGSSSGSISAAGELAGADEFPAGGSGVGRGPGVYGHDDVGACVRAGAGLEAAGLAEHGGDGHFTGGAGAGVGAAAAAVRNHRHSLPPSIVRRNSTSTIYLAAHDTLSDPDLDATIRCVCAVLRAHMIAALADGREDDGGSASGSGTGDGGGGGGGGGDGLSSVSREGGGVWVGERRDYWRGVNVKVFDDPPEEGSHEPAAVPEGGGGREADEAPGEAVVVPPLRDITAFYRDLYHRTCLKFDSIVLSLIYMERLMKETKGAIRPQPWNWKSLIISALVLSSKVWDDNSMWNRDFSEVFPSFSLGRLNQLEVAVLGVLRFNVKVLSSEYAKYYFHLRAMCVRGGLSDSHAPIHPLDMEDIKELEVRGRTLLRR